MAKADVLTVKGPRGARAATAPAPSRRRGRFRRWPARLLAAVLAPLLFVPAAELGLRAFGYGHDPSYFAKAGNSGLYRSNLSFGHRFFPPQLVRDPVPVVFPADKPRGTYRIFVLGGSAAQGVPDQAFGFARVLEAMLNDRFPQARFEVINTGMTAINSHVVLEIARDCAKLQPDLFIVYMGHNEVVGPYGKGSVLGGAGLPRWLIRTSIFLRSTRLGQLLYRAIGALSPGSAEARKWAGMEMFLGNRVTADDPWLEAAYQGFRANLSDICRAARAGGARVVVSTVLTNLRDCPPFASVHRPGLTVDERKRWQAAYGQGRALEARGEAAQAVEQYQHARRIDDRFAELHFHLGQCHLRLGQADKAREELVAARDLDALRFRADTRINQAIRDVAGGRGNEGIHLVDAERLAAGGDGATGGLPGSELLHEHVHLTFEGNCAVASAVFRAVAGLLPPGARGGVPAGVEPPSPERCAELLTFTPCDRLAGAMVIAAITERPPFPKEQGERDQAAVQRLAAQLTGEVLDRAAGQYQQALRRRPDDLLTRSCYARLLSARNRPAEVAEQCRLLLARCPGYRSWSAMLGTVLAQQGKTDEAIAQFRSILRRDPHVTPARVGLADALLKAGRADEAIAEYRQVISYSPDEPRGHVQLGRILLRLNRPNEARACFETAVKLAPEEAEFHFHLGQSLERSGRTAPAIQSYRRAIALMPKATPALQALSLIYATHPDAAVRNGREAVTLAERAVACGGRSPALLDTLAVAYAETGQFDRAVAIEQEAMALAQQLGQKDATERIRGHVALFQQGKPERRTGP